MDYLLVDHPNITEKKKAFKYPQVAESILSMDKPIIFEFFKIKEENGALKNFVKLFEIFMDEKSQIYDEQINYTRAGYIHKIVSNLVHQQPQNFLPAFFAREDIIKNMLDHSYCKSVTNIL